MRVTYRTRQRISRIRAGNARQIQQPPDHFLHLLLGRVTITHYRLLDLQRRVFGYRQVMLNRRAYRRAPRLAKQQSRLRVYVDEHLFNRHLLRLINHDHLPQACQYHFQALRQFALAAPDAAARHVNQAIADFFKHAESGYAQTGVYAQYPYRQNHSLITVTSCSQTDSPCLGYFTRPVSFLLNFWHFCYTNRSSYPTRFAMPSPDPEYIAPTWLPGGNLQTLYPYFFAAKPKLHYRRERWELPDGDFLDLDWVDNPPEQPLVVLFHGLEGNSRGFYSLALMHLIKQRGWRGVVVHFRGCSGEPNRLPRAYFAGDSAEINYVLHRLRDQEAAATIYAVGVSLGGNALLKWLGEQAAAANDIIQAAVGISAPLDLTAAGNALDRGFNQLFYTRHFLSTLKQTALRKLERFPNLFDAARVRAATTLREFDDVVTAPLHGYRDAEEYWRTASSKPGLLHITVPTLIINAKNDPFLPASALPEQNEVSPAVTLNYPEQGGHVGFHSGVFPGHINWLPKYVLHYLERNM